MTHPSGDQIALASGDFSAVVTTTGATLREFRHGDRDLILGFPEDAMCSGGRGQTLLPWPNRIRDGRYTFDGVERQLPLTEAALHNASHGLVRWATWVPRQTATFRVVLETQVNAQPGYPWSLAATLTYSLDQHTGLTVTMTATNLSASTAPFGYGAHPYLLPRSGHFSDAILSLPLDTLLLVDDQKIPVERVRVAGSGVDFRTARVLGSTVMDTAFTEWTGDRVVRLDDLELWMDDAFGWVQCYTGDDANIERRAIAIEPMTCPPNAFATGEDLNHLEPGATATASWGIRLT